MQEHAAVFRDGPTLQEGVKKMQALYKELDDLKVIRPIPEKTPGGGRRHFYFNPTTHGIQFPPTPTIHVIRKFRTLTTHRIQFSPGPVV